VVCAAARMNAKDQDDENLALREEHPPVSHPQPENLFLHALQTLHVSLTRLCEAIHRRDDPLLGLAIQALQVFFCTV